MKRTIDECREIIESVNGNSMRFEQWMFDGNPDITEPRESNQLYYSNLKEDRYKGSPLFTHNYFGYSDYSGSTVEIANNRVWCEEHKRYKNRLFFCITGGYSSNTILFDARYLSTEMIEQLQALSDYPLMNDETLSEVESELESEYVAMDIIPHIRYTLDDHDITDVDEWQIYHDIRESENIEPIFETGGNCYIDQDMYFTTERILTAHYARQ